MAELAPGAIFAGHRIEGVAGRGGMGVVYRATQLALDRTVALKVIAPGLLEDGATRHRFVRESKVAASLDHPNVIPIYYSGEERGIAYIAMRYVGGHDLRALVRGEGRLSPPRAARIVAQVAAGLDAAHAAGLVHRDVKPANVLLTADDHAYLTDFGLTKHALSVGDATKPGQWVGTLDYVAPEQIRGERVDARADVYALGCVLYYALTGRVPYERDGEEAKLWAHLAQDPPTVTERVPAVPAGFDGVIERALAKPADDRYPSAGDLGRAALAAAADEPVRERERVVAMGPAAPVESPTVTSARRAGAEAETVRQQTGEEPTIRQPDSAAETDRRRSRTAAILGGIAAIAVLGGAVAAVLLIGGDDPETRARDPERTRGPATTEPNEPRVAATAQAGSRPNGIAVAGGNIFVLSFRRPTVTVLSERTLKPREVRPRVGFGASDIHAVGDSVWVTAARERRLVRLSARTGRRIGAPISLPAQPTNVTWGRGSLWVGLRTTAPGMPDRLARIDPRTGRTIKELSVPEGVEGLAFARRSLWVLNRRRNAVQAVDPATGALGGFVQVGSGASWIGYGGGFIWTANEADNSVSQVDVRTMDVVPIAVGSHPRRVAVRGNDVWVSNYNDSTLTRIDARTRRVVGEPVQVAVSPYALDIARSGELWVTTLADSEISRVTY